MVVATMRERLNMKKLSEVTAIQQQIVKKQKQLAKVSNRLQPEIPALIKELRGICDHPETRDYHWEDDNGYGRQTQMVAQQCIFCGGVCFWNNKRFSYPDEWVDRSN